MTTRSATAASSSEPATVSDPHHIPGAGLDRGLDRLDEQRGGPDAVDGATRVFPVAGRRVLVRNAGADPDGVARAEASTAEAASTEAASTEAAPTEATSIAWSELRGEEGLGDPVLLGEREGVRYAAVAIDDGAADRLAARFGGSFDSLRHVGPALPRTQAGLLFYASGLLAWHGRSAHCGRCGAPMRSSHAGHRRVCTDEACGFGTFPRTDPAIITLARRGEQALLVRQPSWPDRRFSTLAGFVEPGETLEQAVAREIMEEVGLPVESTSYFTSQPWPFPHSLMIGFRTRVGDGPIRLGRELADARWFHREGLRDGLEAGDVVLPGRYAISRSLIDDWLEETD